MTTNEVQLEDEVNATQQVRGEHNEATSNGTD